MSGGIAQPLGISGPDLRLNKLMSLAPQHLSGGDLPNLRGVAAVPVDDPDFPRAFKSIPNAPRVLWIAGKLLAVDTRAVAVVGSRDASPAAVQDAHEIGRALAKAGHTVVSGLARGVDAAAHRGALSEPGGRTIAVVGTGLDTTYPVEHTDLDAQIRQRGAVISQVPPGTGVHGKNFSARNALIAALSIASVIVIAEEQSGTRVELEHAIAQGKRVFLWHPLMSKADWPARIVKRRGAEFATSVEDLVSRIRDIA